MRTQENDHTALDVNKAPITLMVHGGAGTIRRENMIPEREKACHEVLKQALGTGYAVLQSSGRSLDAVIASIRILEGLTLWPPA